MNAGLKASQQKVISYARISAITQEPNENPITFLERLTEALKKFTNLDLDSYEGQVILKDKFLSQCASDIRVKLQQLQHQDPAAFLDEMVRKANNTFYNREQERDAKTQEREKKERDRSCLDADCPPGKSYGKLQILEGQSTRQMPNL